MLQKLPTTILKRRTQLPEKPALITCGLKFNYIYDIGSFTEH